SRPGLVPVAATAMSIVGPRSWRAEERGCDASPLPFVMAAAGSTSCIGPKPPAALGARLGSHRVRVYETARRTGPGTPNSDAAAANARCSEPLSAAAGVIVAARTMNALATDARRRG